MTITLYVEVPICVRNIVLRELGLRGVGELRDFADYLTDEWHSVSLTTAYSIGAFLAAQHVLFEGISLQITRRKKWQLRLRDIEQEDAVRVGALLIKWAEQKEEQYEAIVQRLHTVVTP